MDDGWGLHFVRRTRKSELSGRNQSPFGTLGSKPQELVAPSGCCLGSGIDTRRSERVGSSKQGYNDQTHFCPPFSLPIVTLRHLQRLRAAKPARAANQFIHILLFISKRSVSGLHPLRDSRGCEDVAVERTVD